MGSALPWGFGAPGNLGAGEQDTEPERSENPRVLGAPAGRDYMTLAVAAGPFRNHLRLLKNNFSFGVRRVSDYGGAQAGAHDDGQEFRKESLFLLLPSGGRPTCAG